MAFGDSGHVDLTKGLRRKIDRELYGFIAPPVVVGDVVVAGSFVGDKERHAPPGDVRGFDRYTGEQLWVFHTIPQAGEFGVETWADTSWKHHGGVNVWSMMSADSIVCLNGTSPPNLLLDAGSLAVLLCRPAYPLEVRLSP